MNTSLAWIHELAPAFEAGLPLLLAISRLTALVLIARVGYRMAYHHPPQHVPITLGSVVLVLFLAGLLLSLPTTIEHNVQLFGGPGASYRSALALTPPPGASNWLLVALVQAIGTWVFLIAAVATYRGILLWVQLANGGSAGSGASGDLFWRGLWHIVFSALAINLVNLL